MTNKSVKWTPEQSSAISLRDRTLLVSAAAGSGKTAVLTERIIKKLTDKENPSDISRFLIVTYTKAAASELKSRISKAISAAISEDPSNKHLARQLLLLNSAKISTIHSFCLDAIKKNLQTLNLPKGLSVANDTEMLLYSREIMNEILDEAYSGNFVEGHEIDNFEDFIDTFAKNGNDSAVTEIFLGLYKKLMSYPEGTEFLSLWADILKKDADNSFFASTHGKIITQNISEKTEYLLLRYNALFEEIRDNDEFAFGKYSSVMTEDISFISSLHGSLSSARADLAKSFVEAFVPTKQPGMSKGQSRYTEPLKKLRGEMRDLLQKTVYPLFGIPEEIIREQTLRTSDIVKALYHILTAFDIRFREEKLKMLKLDYSDIERYAFSLLVKDEKPTEIARELSESFDEIYIDEYQDTNSVQDMIFSAVAKEDNRFMVGDIKQSIYGFRGAAPENFARYRDAFELYDANRNTADAKSNTIFLADNFRCDASVVDFCNRIFSRLFTNNTGRIKYYPHDDLVCSKSDGKENNTSVKVVLAKNPTDATPGITEAEYIANEITALLNGGHNKDGSRIKPSDIAVLVRAKSSSVEIEERLNDLGVSTSNNVETEFFENPEILLMVSLLNTIDNPNRDIYLAGTLKSPIFNFTLDELVKIRASSKAPSLYGALVEYTNETGFEKGKQFLDKLSHFRQLTTGTRIDRLIWKLYKECKMFRIVADNHSPDETPLSARENLMLLYKYARGFESSTFKGLNAFINYVDDIILEKTKLPGKGAGKESADSVKIMTVHQSKGLEFPVVFLASANKNISSGLDSKLPVLMERHAGVSVDITDPLKVSKISTLHRTALDIRMKENEYEEEMRILYVALTRAREKLYVTGNFKNPEKELEKARENAGNLCKYVVMRNTSFMQLILTTLFNSGDGDYECIIADSINGTVALPSFDHSIDDGDSIFKNISDNLNFRYPFEAAKTMPSKLSVSELTHNALDTVDDADEERLFEKLNAITPEFIIGDSKTVTGADRGTATHIFMQFCNFELTENNGVEEEISRLVNRHYITSQAAELIDAKKAQKFFNSKLYLDTVKGAKKIRREYRFNVEFPATEFTDSTDLKNVLAGETLFVQGIIDCFTENADGTLTLIDYKTDYIPSEMQFDQACEMLAERHKAQLSYYRRALEMISKKKVSKVYIYSFGLGCEIDATEYC